MPDGRNWFAGVDKGFQQFRIVPVDRKIPERTVAAGIVHGVVFIRHDLAQRDRFQQKLLFPFKPDVRLEEARLCCPHAVRVDRYLPAARRGGRHLVSGLGQDVMRKGEILQPDTRFPVPQYPHPIVRCDDEQYFFSAAHRDPPSCFRSCSPAQGSPHPGAGPPVTMPRLNGKIKSSEEKNRLAS